VAKLWTSRENRQLSMRAFDENEQASLINLGQLTWCRVA